MFSAGATISATLLFFMVVGAVLSLILSIFDARLPPALALMTGSLAIYSGINLFVSMYLEELETSLLLQIELGSSPVFAGLMLFAFGGMTLGALTAQRI